ncbi:hypothetical protein [Mycobacterium innocens]|uniref:hypothetical protein n=1 Tax=Mycobacterium innocens TaxID=2341083 RepID=UPI00142D809F|nr:hypothetical protein [Mycobacterium innocens]
MLGHQQGCHDPSGNAGVGGSGGPATGFGPTKVGGAGGTGGTGGNLLGVNGFDGLT